MALPCEQISQVVGTRTANFINLPRQHKRVYPQCLDLRCFGMLLFEFLDTRVERGSFLPKPFDLRVLLEQLNWLQNPLFLHDACPCRHAFVNPNRG